MSARSVWKGSIKFSVIQIPSKFFGATDSRKSIPMHQLCPDCQGRISQKIVCQACNGKEIERSRLLKGYEWAKDQNVILTEDELKGAEREKSDTIDLISFIDRDDVPPIYFSDSLYIAPEKVGVDLFALLRTAMEDTQTVAVGKITMRNRENLILIAPYQKYMIGYILYYAEQIKNLDEIPGKDLLDKANLDENLLGMVVTLIEQLRKPFVPTEYRDEYNAIIMAAIERKINPLTAQAEAQAPPPPKSNVVNLKDLLKNAIAQTKKPEMEKAA